MVEKETNYLSRILRKRIETLGYTSLKKFVEDKKDFQYSYELLRQVVYGGRLPRAETLLSILQTMRFSPSQIHKLMDFHFGGYPGGGTDSPGETAGIPDADKREPFSRPEHRESSSTGIKLLDADPSGAQADLLADSPEETAMSLRQSLPRIPFKGNEDFWEMARALALQAERKALRIARREAD
ncbi:MAG: hypothetical protein E4H29_04005, partial [Deltaproteobacteria bacterium]